MAPRDSSSIYPSNLLDLVRAAAWAPPNLPLFPGAPAPMGAPLAVSAPAAGAPPWLRPLHELQHAVLSPNPPDPASSGDTAGSSWALGWSATPRTPAAAPPYADRAASSPYLGSAAGAGELDPARTRRLLAEGSAHTTSPHGSRAIPVSARRYRWGTSRQRPMGRAPARRRPASMTPLTSLRHSTCRPRPHRRGSR